MKTCKECKNFIDNKCSLSISEEIKLCIESDLYYFVGKEENIEDEG